MKFSPSPATVTILALLAGCGDQGDAPLRTGDASTIGASPDAGGSAAMDAGSSAAMDAGGLNPGSADSGVDSGGRDSGSMSNTGQDGGSSATSDSGSAIPATFDTVKLIITETTCFGAGCHNDDQNPLNLRVDDQLHMRLRSRISKACGNIPVVNPGKPQESALIKILKGPCGATQRMPLGCVDDQDATCVPPDYLAAIERWIAAGAPAR
jgi:hypothetical protein